MMTQLTQAEQNKVDTLKRLVDKELDLSKKQGIAERRCEFDKAKKLSDQVEKIFSKFTEKYKKLPEHCAPQVETYTGYIWEEFQENDN